MKNSNTRALKTLAVVGLVGVLNGVNIPSTHSQTERAFSEDKVLSVSEEDYAESVRKSLDDYDRRGIQFWVERNCKLGVERNCKLSLVKKVQNEFPNAEVVVNFTYKEDYWGNCYGYGMTLIPK